MATFYRSDGWVKAVLGFAVAGAQVYVCTQPANTSSVPPSPLAQVYSDPAGASPITQPIFTDGFGHYDFYAASGFYTVVIVNGGNVQQVYTDQTVGLPGATSGQVTSNEGNLGIGQVVVGNNGFDIQTTGVLLSSLAPLVGPAFSGVPTAPTAAPLTNNQQIATTKYTDSAVAAVSSAAVLLNPGNVTQSIVSGNVQINNNLNVSGTLGAGATTLFSLSIDSPLVEYNGILPVGMGVPVEYAQTLNPSLTANFNGGSAFTLIPSGGLVGVTFVPTQVRITWFQSIIVAAGTSSTFPSLTLGYTDAGGIARTVILVATSAVNTTAVLGQGTEIIYIDTEPNSKVTITSAGYASNPASAMTYCLCATAEIM
jgi:hypothetical protein